MEGKVGALMQGDVQGGMINSEKLASVSVGHPSMPGHPSSDTAKEDRQRDKRKYTGEIN